MHFLRGLSHVHVLCSLKPVQFYIINIFQVYMRFLTGIVLGELHRHWIHSVTLYSPWGQNEVSDLLRDLLLEFSQVQGTEC